MAVLGWCYLGHCEEHLGLELLADSMNHNCAWAYFLMGRYQYEVLGEGYFRQFQQVSSPLSLSLLSPSPSALPVCRSYSLFFQSLTLSVSSVALIPLFHIFVIFQ